MEGITVSQRGAEAYVSWLDKADECLIEATNALGWLGPGELDFDDALIRVLNQIAEKHGIRLVPMLRLVPCEVSTVSTNTVKAAITLDALARQHGQRCPA